jgi:hypothetical protein
MLTMASERNLDLTSSGLTQDQWRRLCLRAFENLPTDTQVTMEDVDSILTWCLPAYDDMRAGQQSPDATPSDEDRIRDAMAEAAEHPGRIVTR